jgi:hypothetical protein
MQKIRRFKMSSPTMRAVLRWVRTAAAIGIAAGITWGMNNVTTLPVSAAVAIVIGSGLAAIDKYARDRGWY